MLTIAGGILLAIVILFAGVWVLSALCAIVYELFTRPLLWLRPREWAKRHPFKESGSSVSPD